VCASSFATASTVKCLSDYNKNPLPSGTCQTTVVSSGVAVFLPIFVRYHQNDLSLFPAGYTPGQPYIQAGASGTSGSGTGSSSRASQTSNSSTTTAVSPPNSASTNANSSGLSTSAKIGIGLGVPLAVLLIAGIFLSGFVWGRRRRRNQEQIRLQSAGGEVKPDDTEIKKDPQTSDELDARASEIYELPSPIAELGGHSVPVQDLKR
jgi:hypothetical protein